MENWAGVGAAKTSTSSYTNLCTEHSWAVCVHFRSAGEAEKLQFKGQTHVWSLQSLSLPTSGTLSSCGPVHPHQAQPAHGDVAVSLAEHFPAFVPEGLISVNDDLTSIKK